MQEIIFIFCLRENFRKKDFFLKEGREEEKKERKSKKTSVKIAFLARRNSATSAIPK